VKLTAVPGWASEHRLRGEDVGCAVGSGQDSLPDEVAGLPEVCRYARLSFSPSPSSSFSPDQPPYTWRKEPLRRRFFSHFLLPPFFFVLLHLTMPSFLLVLTLPSLSRYMARRLPRLERHLRRNGSSRVASRSLRDVDSNLSLRRDQVHGVRQAAFRASPFLPSFPSPFVPFVVSTGRLTRRENRSSCPPPQPKPPPVASSPVH
jgi:hypothetical protein